MSERNYWVLCDDNCKFEGMTKEQIIAAIAEATGATPTQIDAAFITKIKEQNKNTPLKFWIGTQAEYNALTEIDANVFYIFSDSDELTEIEQLAETTAAAKATELINVEKAKSGVVLYDGSIPYGETLETPVTVENLMKYQLIEVLVGTARVIARVGKTNENSVLISGVGSGNLSNEYFIVLGSLQLRGTYNGDNATITSNRSSVATIGSDTIVPTGMTVQRIIGIY